MAGGKATRLSGFDFDFPILYITGELYTSLTQGAPEHYLVVGADSIRSGTEVFFAHFHQYGEGRNPERRIILTPDTETQTQMARSVSGGFSLMIQSFL
jgi:phage gpG-like protein